MNNKLKYLFCIPFIVAIISLSFINDEQEIKYYDTDIFITKVIDPKKETIRLIDQNDKNKNIGSFKELKQFYNKQSKKLVFAMNGGMYLKDRSPQGLYIENNKLLKALDTIQKGYGNFYMQPNGVFGITTNNEAIITKSSELGDVSALKYATQSGPMLLINGNVHKRFNKGSKNLNIRNGVGILPDGKLIFAISNKKVNFYSFAVFFKKLGCKNALYLDGYVSKMYYPGKQWDNLGGNFGVIIAEIEE